MKGRNSATQLRDFLQVMDREKAAGGIFITLDKTGRSGAEKIAADAGRRKIGADGGPRCVLWSIEEMFEEERPPGLPTLVDPGTGQALL